MHNQRELRHMDDVKRLIHVVWYVLGVGLILVLLLELSLVLYADPGVALHHLGEHRPPLRVLPGAEARLPEVVVQVDDVEPEDRAQSRGQVGLAGSARAEHEDAARELERGIRAIPAQI